MMDKCHFCPRDYLFDAAQPRARVSPALGGVSVHLGKEITDKVATPAAVADPLNGYLRNRT